MLYFFSFEAHCHLFCTLFIIIPFVFLKLILICQQCFTIRLNYQVKISSIITYFPPTLIPRVSISFFLYWSILFKYIFNYIGKMTHSCLMPPSNQFYNYFFFHWIKSKLKLTKLYLKDYKNIKTILYKKSMLYIIN